jgi:hypothetical protein
MRNKLFIIKQQDPEINNVCGSIKAVPIWVHLTNIPIFAWSPLGINWLANRLGKLVCMDEMTEKQDRLKFAKCLMEISSKHDLIKSFAVQIYDGSTQTVYVD